MVVVVVLGHGEVRPALAVAYGMQYGEEKGRLRSPPHVQNVASAVWVFALQRNDRRLCAQIKCWITGRQLCD
eukprot:3146158-Pleurochrysis_carterae.AAC.1